MPRCPLNGKSIDELNSALVPKRFLLGATGSCEILNLVLGPLDLNLLGLEVHLDQVVLNITAQAGAGNLLGNLLCAVANLLNSGGFLSILEDLTALLNQIFRRI